MARSPRLGVRLALAFTLSTAAMAVVCIVALVSLVDVSDQARAVVSAEVDLLRDAAAFDALLYQKGYVGDYMLTRDPVWLRKLDETRLLFSRWRAHSSESLSPAERDLLEQIVLENEAYNGARRTAIELFDGGSHEEAIAMIPAYHAHIDRLVELSQAFGNIARLETEQALWTAERSIRRLAWLLVATSLISAISSVIVGFLWARRIARPMYQLQLQIESAAARTQIRVAEASADFHALTGQLAALVEKAESADAALAQQRRRLIQSEKMSAVGELTTKLAHEILNPLAGIKAAVQLLGMQAEAGELAVEPLRATTLAVDQEVTRIEQLMRRLIGYARPLAPDIQVCDVESLLQQAIEAVERQLHARRWPLCVRLDPGVPPLELDRLLMTQVFVNLLRNAAEAMPQGGPIVSRVFVAEHHARREVHIEVVDEGPGLSNEQLSSLFTPFQSTKTSGHGLGLATSRNIVHEHGGTIDARNRADRSGAIFCVALPVLR